jgi:hypothetical protein
VTTPYDVTEAGVASVSYLYFDGADDAMATSTVTPGIDKVQIFAGVRKLGDTNKAILESSAAWFSNNGSFSLQVALSNAANYYFGSYGTGYGETTSPTNFSAPITNVLTALGDISGDRATLRANGVQVSQATTDQGTGNYLAYPLYLGSRAGTSLFFQGHLYSLVVRFGANLDAPTIASTEAYVAGKTGIVI